jgi:hypothetical protein
LKVKSEVPVIVCLGNPPYDRHEATIADEEGAVLNRARTGGWVRWGDEPTHSDAIFSKFLDPAVAAGHGVHVKNLYNLYVYFWRWALWKVFEQDSARGPGVVSFISASSYLDGDAFCGMREHMRRICDEIWILDLGGEGRGTRRSENIFAIQTPVSIAIAVRARKAKEDRPAKVHYAKIEGGRDAKLAALDAIAEFKKVKWQDCPDNWHAPFRPAGRGKYFDWPLLTDLMPWQHSGVQAKRTWPIAPDAESLERRWRALLRSDDRSKAFRETEDRRTDRAYRVSLGEDASSTPVAELPKNAPAPKMHRYGYRTLDRQFILADARLLSRPRPDLWRAHGDRQIYVTSLLTKPLGGGPALTACSSPPDLDHFSGRGAKDVAPLYRDARGSEPNLFPCMLNTFGAHYRRKLSPEDMLAYFYGILAHPAFTARFSKELETRQLRVPIARDPKLFEKVRAAGARLLWLHTYGERFVPKGKRRGRVPRGAAKCVKAVPGRADAHPESFEHNASTETLRVGEGEFRPVAREVFEFEVSGLKVVQSWLKYRMKRGAGKKSSPLDDIRPERWTGQFTTELLELLWVLEATVVEYPKQETFLEEVVGGPCFRADEMPEVPPELREPPGDRPSEDDMFGGAI